MSDKEIAQLKIEILIEVTKIASAVHETDVIKTFDSLVLRILPELSPSKYWGGEPLNTFK